MNSGYILLWRKFRDWEWYSDINVRIIYQDLILSANWETKEWKGIMIKRGQRLTSYQSLADKNSLTVKQVRTALKKLIKTNYITQKTNNKYQIITILDYANYQDFSKINKKNEKKGKQKTDYIEDINVKNENENEQEGKQRANKGQTKGNKEYIIKTLKNIKISPELEKKEKELFLFIQNKFAIQNLELLNDIKISINKFFRSDIFKERYFEKAFESFKNYKKVNSNKRLNNPYDYFTKIYLNIKEEEEKPFIQ